MIAAAPADLVMTDAEYRAAAGVNWHQLADVAVSPRLHYRKNVMKLIPDKDAEWKRFGTAYHTMTLEGRTVFDQRYVVPPAEFLTEGGAVSKAKAAKAWAMLPENAQRIPIAPDDVARCVIIAERVRANPFAAALLAGASCEVVRFGVHTATGLCLKGKIDVLGADFAADLKGCQNLDTFVAEARAWHYPKQVAYYARLGCVQNGYLIAVEKDEPHRVGVWRITDSVMADAHNWNDVQLHTLARCIERDEWPGDPEAIQLFDVASGGA